MPQSARRPRSRLRFRAGAKPGYATWPSQTADVAYYRDMVTIIRDRVRAMKARGMSLDEVVAARPTRDYDARWGVTTGSWTTDMFVEAVYRTVEPAM